MTHLRSRPLSVRHSTASSVNQCKRHLQLRCPCSKGYSRNSSQETRLVTKMSELSSVDPYERRMIDHNLIIQAATPAVQLQATILGWTVSTHDTRQPKLSNATCTIPQQPATILSCRQVPNPPTYQTYRECPLNHRDRSNSRALPSKADTVHF